MQSERVKACARAVGGAAARCWVTRRGSIPQPLSNNKRRTKQRFISGRPAGWSFHTAPSQHRPRQRRQQWRSVYLGRLLRRSAVGPRTRRSSRRGSGSRTERRGALAGPAGARRRLAGRWRARAGLRRPWAAGGSATRPWMGWWSGMPGRSRRGSRARPWGAKAAVAAGAAGAAAGAGVAAADQPGVVVGAALARAALAWQPRLIRQRRRSRRSLLRPRAGRLTVPSPRYSMAPPRPTVCPPLYSMALQRARPCGLCSG